MDPREVVRNAECGMRNERVSVHFAFRIPHSAFGFTLIEVLLALTLGALVVLCAHRIFSGVTDGALRLTAAQAALDRAANARRLLTQLVGSVDVGEGAGGFDGAPHRVAFSTWVLQPEGWLVRGRVTIQETDGDVVVTGVAGHAVALADGIASLDLDYLLEYGAEAAWVRTWQSPVSAPLAVRLRIVYGPLPSATARYRPGGVGAGPVDTLLLIVGPR